MKIEAPLFRELSTLKARKVSPSAYVFPSGSGGKLSDDNLRARMWDATVKRANALLDEGEHPPLPVGLTLHKLRHTYISVRVALGDNIAEIAQDVGHADMSTTQRIYTHVMRRDEGARDRLRALMAGEQKADNGGNDALPPPLALVAAAA